MAKIEQFSIAPEFNDIIPILEEWTHGAPEGGKAVYGGRYAKSKSYHICQAIRMYARHTQQFLELVYKNERTIEEEEQYERMAAERRKLLAPLSPAEIEETAVIETTTAGEIVS